MTTRWELSVEAEADVEPAPDPSCVDVHPGEPCPGLPHDEDDES